MFQIDAKFLNKIHMISTSDEMREYMEEQTKDVHMQYVYGMAKLNEQGLLTRKANRLYFFMIDFMMDKYEIYIDEIIYA